MADASGEGRGSARPLALLLVMLVVAAALMVIAAVMLWQKSSDDGVVLKENAVIYREGESSFAIIASDGDSVTVDSVAGLAEGNVICAGITEATPNGLLCKVGRPVPVEEGFRIPIQQAALTDVIEKCDVKATVAIDEEGGHLIDQPPANRTSPFVDQAFADEGGFLFERASDWPLFAVEKEPLSASMLQCLEVEVHIDREKMFFRLVDAFSLEASLDGIEFEEMKLFEKSLRPIQFNIGPVPVVVVPNFSAEAHFDGSAHGLGFSAEEDQKASLSGDPSEKCGFEVTGRIEKCFGFEYTTDGGFQPIGEDRSWFSRPTIAPVDEMFGVDIEGGVSLAFRALLYGVSGVELSSGLAMRVSAEMSMLPPGQSPSGALELPGSSKKFSGALSQKITIPISGSLVVEELNAFGYKLADGCSLTLFDTDDAITLLDETMEFRVGENLDSDGTSDNVDASPDENSGAPLHKDAGSGRVVCTTKVSGGIPPLLFVHPVDWECHSEGNSETLDLILGPHSASIQVGPDGVEGATGNWAGLLQYQELGGGDMWVVFDPERMARVTKVADAVLALPGEDPGSYVVAEASYPRCRSDDPSDLHTELVLIPTTFLQRCPLSTMQDTNFVVFDFLGRAVSFSIDLEGLNEEARQEAIGVLASLRVAA
ncbi:hypothetical protein [Adlercreutzia caecimuris]|uniref:hypothetical protein n=1 Tax=Adlercreutzia caecimuris TaxID=671266 RepID=UPI0024945BFA|nr:hypothetical protein [Adlercreutzia caecimuris]